MCFFVDTIGRRKLFLTSTTGMLVAFIVWTVYSSRYAMDGSSAAAKAVIGMIFIYYFFYNLAWSGLLIGYTAEIFSLSQASEFRCEFRWPRARSGGTWHAFCMAAAHNRDLATQIHVYEVYAHEVHAYKVHAREVDAHDVHACEVDAHEMH